ncbi:hypothetical protein HK100_003967 [Physocladia obscura]|uniref:Uncharacterized protein n=1 Tax=Physocladia obscura TaxID=109957 RepID=A0AAD5SVM8_9FUNG|nr:hypothetical protein HK100_003967 [Physocladia obscura]
MATFDENTLASEFDGLNIQAATEKEADLESRFLAVLAERDHVIHEKEKEIIAKNRIIHEKECEITAKDSAIAERDRIIRGKKRKVTVKNRELAERDSEIASLKHKLQKSDKVNLKLQKMADEANLKFQKMTDEADSLLRNLISKFIYISRQTKPEEMEITDTLLSAFARQYIKGFKKYWPYSSFNGISTLKCLPDDILKNVQLSNSFVHQRLVEKGRSFLSVGSGNGSFEKALVNMRDCEETEKWRNVVISPSNNCPHDPEIPVDRTHEINATELKSLKSYGLPAGATILFNRPWRGYGKTFNLIMEFMKSAFNVQNEGGFVLLGITECYIYFPQYQLEKLVVKMKKNYCLKYIDVGIINNVLKHGYTHYSESEKNIHNLVVSKHIMLCFKRL